MTIKFILGSLILFVELFLFSIPKLLDYCAYYYFCPLLLDVLCLLT